MHAAVLFLAPLLMPAPSSPSAAAPSAPAYLDVSADADGIVLEEVTDHQQATARSGYALATVRAESYRSLCVAPCRLEIAPGYHELRIESGGSSATYHAMLAPGENRITARAGNGWLNASSLFLIIAGAVAIPIGAALTALSFVPEVSVPRTTSIAVLASGGGALALGIPLGLWGSAHLGATPGTRGALPAVRVSASF